VFECGKRYENRKRVITIKHSWLKIGVICLTVFLCIISLVYADFTWDAPNTPRDFTSDGVYYHHSGGNSYFSANQTLNLSRIEVSESYVEFNDTRFSVEGENQVNVSLVFIHSNVSDASEGDYVLRFYADTSSGVSWFNLSNGFVDDYLIYEDTVFDEGIYSTDDNISFSTTPSDTLIGVRLAMSYDIVLDTDIDYLDASSLTSHYGESGANGWIRDDINDDGDVDYLDASGLTSHYNEEY